MGYILLQFLWWEILLVKQNGIIISEKQKLIALTSSNERQLQEDIAVLNQRKKTQTVMIVSEGTVFLLLLLFGIYKIKQTQDKEVALIKQQKNFFLSITHELKTPIAATKLQLQTMQKQKLDETTRQDLISKALMETERLNMLIDNVLLASRLESGEFAFHKENSNLSQLTLSTVNRYYKNQIRSGALQLNIEDDLEANIDTQAFPSLLTNLVDNALKYSMGKPEVEIALKTEKQALVLSVKDQGVGISYKDKQKIFDKFFRAGSEETRRSKGTGLGLFIVAYIAEKHKAKIKVRDNTPRGSIFEIRFNKT
jgi:signal transduction histidine kinase